jgi:hypothetical protein
MDGAEMNSMELKALRYVQNTNGGATLDNFTEDHEPIGKLLWKNMSGDGLVNVGADGKVQLTEKGKNVLSASTPQKDLTA